MYVERKSIRTEPPKLVISVIIRDICYGEGNRVGKLPTTSPFADWKSNFNNYSFLLYANIPIFLS